MLANRQMYNSSSGTLKYTPPGAAEIPLGGKCLNSILHIEEYIIIITPKTYNTDFIESVLGNIEAIIIAS